MKDNSLIALLGTQVRLGLAAGSYTGFTVLQAVQPTQQGIPTAPTIYIQKLFDDHYGSPAVSYSYDPVTELYTTVEEQICETHFSVMSIVRQNPLDTTIPTSSDVSNQLKMFLTSRPTMAILKANEASLLRVMNVRNPYSEDDTHRFQAFPSFEIIIRHNRNLTYTVGAAFSADDITVGF